MSLLSEDVAELEKAAADGLLSGRDLEVIARQVGRAEAKLLRALRGSPLKERPGVAIMAAAVGAAVVDGVG